MLSLLIFAGVIGAVVYLHFAIAHRAWRKLAAQPTSEIDVDYVRIEDYFGQSFRHKLREWLQLPEDPVSTTQLRSIQKGQERILAMGTTHCPVRRRTSDILVIDGNFTTDQDCSFAREIFVTGNCKVGANSTLQALAVDGDLELGDGVVVRRWVDAHGAVVTHSDVRIDSRLTSRTRIKLGHGSRALSAFAPEVVTEAFQDLEVSYPRPGNALEIPPRVRPSGDYSGSNFEPRLLFQASADTWVYRGDLKLSSPLYLRAKLVVRGECILPAGSYLEDDLKATGRLVVGRNSFCRGSLVSDSDVTLECDVMFQGAVYAGKDLRMDGGVRGLGQSPVIAYAAHYLYVEPNIRVKGKLSAGLHVVAVPAGFRLRTEF